jgi:hypothetical protein
MWIARPPCTYSFLQEVCRAGWFLFETVVLVNQTMQNGLRPSKGRTTHLRNANPHMLSNFDPRDCRGARPHPCFNGLESMVRADSITLGARRTLPN